MIIQTQLHQIERQVYLTSKSLQWSENFNSHFSIWHI